MNRREFMEGSILLGTTAGLNPAAVAQRSSGPGGQGFKVGYAERDVSPAIGMEVPGGLGRSYHKTFHDPCKVRVAVFDDGSKRAALVGIDVVAIGRNVVQAARKEIERQCGIAPDAVLVGASHSHSAGPLARFDENDYAGAPPVIRQLAAERNGDPAYTKQCVEGIVAAVVEADRKRSQNPSGVGSGREDRVAFNRRLRMKNGLTYTHPGQGNPDIIGYAGPTDPEVGVIGTWDRNGRLVGCVVNYACHATTSPQGISANWIYYMEKVIRGAFGPDVVVVFLQGACGDVTQVDNLSPHRNPDGEKWAELVGGRVGAEAVRTLLTIHPGGLMPVDFGLKVLKINYRVPDPERVRKCLELVQKDPKTVDPTDLGFAKRTLLLHGLVQLRPAEELEVQAVQVGPAVFISNPAELFCQFGLDLKAKSPFSFTYPVELANGWVGYVPTEDAFGPNGGGYETRIGVSRLDVSAGRQMVDAGLELARRMKPGVPPEPPSAPPFRSPWSYGNVPPQIS